MTEKSATDASNDFFLEFRAERQAIQDQLTRSKDLSKVDLPQHFNAILQNINNLEKRLTKATEYIPSYDERQFSLQLKDLTETLETTKAELTPKAKFSFKSRKKKAAATVEATAMAATVVSKNETEILSDATVLFKDKTETVLTLKDAQNARDHQKSVDILLSNLSYCVILLEDKDIKISAVHIKNVDHCLIFCGSIEGSVLMYGLKHSVLFVGCHQLRMHEAHKVDMMLHVTSRPIIEDSDEIQVGSWDINPSTNYYDQMEDFNWLKKQASPNWRIMDQDRYEQLKHKTEVLRSENIVFSEELCILPA